MQTEMTLVFPIRDNGVWLGRKLVRIGEGSLTGFGGRREKGETMQECAARELNEESGLTINKNDLIYHGILRIDNPKYASELGTLVVHVYTVRKFRGHPKRTDEMIPLFIEFNQMPWDTAMRETEYYWLPAVFRGHHIICEIEYDKKEKLVSCKTTVSRARP